MFRRSEPAFSSFGLAGTLALSQSSVLPAPREGRFAELSERLGHFELAPDLGANIGSATWFRGVATCIALCALPISLWPGLRAMPVATQAAPVGDALKDQRALAIMPQALGSDTGKRMAATDAVIPLTDIPERPTLDLQATVGQGDGFVRVLERAGVGAGEAARAAALVSEAVGLGEIKPGTPIKITLGRRASRTMARPLDFLAFRAKIDLALAIKRDGGGLRLERMPIAVDRTPLRIQGTVGDSLYLSARAAGVSAKTAQAYLQALSSKITFGELDRGARFDLIVERARAATGEVETGKLIYAGIAEGRSRTQLLPWTVSGRTDWYEASGVGRQVSGMIRPVEFARISSVFGMRRHPLLGYSRMHQGTDYAAAYGTPIRAVSDGLVAFAGRHGGHGNYVRLSHSGTLGTGYGHMSRIAVSPGSRVSRGQIIGYVGSTGLSTGPHLHFEVYRNGSPVSPASVNFGSQTTLDKRELARFRARLGELLALPVGGGQ